MVSPRHNDGSLDSIRSRVSTRGRRLSAVLRSAVGLKSSSLSSRLLNDGTRWPVAPATELPIDLHDLATVDRFKIEQVRVTSLLLRY